MASERWKYVWFHYDLIIVSVAAIMVTKRLLVLKNEGTRGVIQNKYVILPANDSHYKDKIFLTSINLHNEISCTGKMTSLILWKKN